ncbi:MAG TPA: TonB-dependent receptor [Chitinophagaceae bacterium]|nr:TonB-dependent receptor [Chitinophagaceae bacterium]
MPTCFIQKCFGAFIIACLLSASSILAQEKVIGIVTTSTGTPLSGATINLINTPITATTISDGSFTINAKPGNTIVVSYVGYRPRLIKIGSETSLKISLSESVISLDEVVVTGYTAQRVKEITGSVSIVKPKDLIAVPAGQVEQMLQGRVAGLTVITSGLPGGPSNVRLHGIGNFGDVTPLYIIDGVQGDINSLNPNDVESVQVLKDAGAYSIYGVRGANGVVVITTKSGKQGRSKISYNFYVGTQRPLKYSVDLLDPQEMADLTWLALKNSNQPLNHPLYGSGPNPVLPDYFIAGINKQLFAGNPAADPALNNIDFANGNIYQIVEANKMGTDWFHELYKPALSQNHSLTVSGANEKNKYAFSVGYLDQQGTLLNTWFKRFTTRINTEFNVLNTIRIGENLQWSYRDKGGIPDYGSPIDNDMLRAITTHPLLPVHDIGGGWAHLLPNVFFDNPVALRVIAKDDKSQSWETFGNVYAEVDLLKNFTIRTSFGGNINNYLFNRFDYVTYQPLVVGSSLANNSSDSLTNNSFTEVSGYRRSWTWTNTIKFSKTFKSDHHISALAGTEAINNYFKEVGGRSIGLYSNDPNFRLLSNGRPDAIYSDASASSLFAFISQADYGFKEKYFLRATLRKDGASFFGPQNRYGWFPAVSAAWRISEENFLNQSKWIDELKLRASWGKSGFYGNTDPANQYTLYSYSPATSYYDISGSGNSSRQGFRVARIGDPNTGWQEDVVTNIGFESVFWNGKLSMNVDLYKKKAKGLLLTAVLPAILGSATPPNTNVGVIENKGIDILLGSKGHWSKDWSWDATVTISSYANKIIKLNEQAFIESGFGNKRYVRNEVGHPISSFYGFKVIGIFKDAGEVSKAPYQDEKKPGRFRYLDVNGDDTVNAKDRIYIGDPNPDLTLGLNFSINYKNFDFTVFFYGCFGNEVVNIPRSFTDFYQPADWAKSKALLYDSWTPEHTDARLPMAELDNNFSTNQVVNSYVVEDGSYFRNKSMILGYTLPGSWLQKIKVEKMRLYIQAVNLFTITNYTGLDPELSGNSAAFGIDYGNFPNNQKQFVFGIGLNF